MKKIVELSELIKISKDLMANGTGMFQAHPRGEWDLVIYDGSLPSVVVNYRAYCDENINFLVRRDIRITGEQVVDAINRRFPNALSYSGIKSSVYTCQL